VLFRHFRTALIAGNNQLFLENTVSSEDFFQQFFIADFCFFKITFYRNNTALIVRFARKQTNEKKQCDM
jgi:hypothetical protein